MSQNTAERESPARLATFEEPTLAHRLDASLMTVMAIACGPFLLVSLGDRIDRRKSILGQAAVLIVILGVFSSAARRHNLQSPHTASSMQVTRMRTNLLGTRATSVGFRTLNYSPASMAFGGRKTAGFVLEGGFNSGRPFVKLNVPKGAS
jgi:hypothetical protein